MSKLRVQSFAISIDGYGAGPNQDLQNPLGARGPELMEWFFHTRVWRRMHGDDDGETGVDNGIAEQGFAGIGAWILGRNMFGPVLLEKLQPKYPSLRLMSYSARPEDNGCKADRSSLATTPCERDDFVKLEVLSSPTRGTMLVAVGTSTRFGQLLLLKLLGRWRVIVDRSYVV